MISTKPKPFLYAIKGYRFHITFFEFARFPFRYFLFYQVLHLFQHSLYEDEDRVQRHYERR